jgi:hypothetical protein
MLLGCDWMNDKAARSAAISRFGGISVEHMLRDTSIAKIMVVCPAGIAVTVTGLLSAITNRAKAVQKAANGICRFHAENLGCAAWMSDKLENRTTVRLRRRSIQMYAATKRGISGNNQKAKGHKKSMRAS